MLCRHDDLLDLMIQLALNGSYKRLPARWTVDAAVCMRTNPRPMWQRAVRVLGNTVLQQPGCSALDPRQFKKMLECVEAAGWARLAAELRCQAEDVL